MTEPPVYTLLGSWPWHESGDGDGQWGPPAGCRGSIDLAPCERIRDAKPGQPRPVGIFACDEIPSDWDGAVLANEDLREARPDARQLDAWESMTGYRPAGETLADCLWDHLTAGCRRMMLMPTLKRRLEVWLGGITPLRSEAFDPRTHPLAGRWLEAVREQLAALRGASLAGELISAGMKQVDREYHLRFADALLEAQVGRSANLKAELFAAVRPADWPLDEQPQPHATDLTESFPSNSTTISSGQDQTWAEVAGDLEVAANKLRSVGGAARGRVEADFSSPNLYAQIDLVGGSTSTTRYGGPAALYAGAADTCYVARQAGGASGLGIYQLHKLIAGTFTALGAGTAGVTQIATKRLECTSGTIAIYSAGSLIETISDSSINGTSVGGLRGGAAISSNAADINLDNWGAGDLVSGQPARRRCGGFRPGVVGQAGVRIF